MTFNVVNKKGKGYTRYCYTTLKVSELSGRSLQSVRRDIRSGKLDMTNFMKVAEYVKTYSEWRESKP